MDLGGLLNEWVWLSRLPSAEHVSVDLDGAKLWSLEFGTLFYGRSRHTLTFTATE